MAAAVTLLNRQRRLRLDLPRIRRLAVHLTSLAERSRGAPPSCAEVVVVLVDDRGSAKAHAASFGDPSATDVITLSYDPMPGIADARTGELVVNVERAHGDGVRRARNGRWSPDRELALYIAHGLDHLNGADDRSPDGFAAMRRRDLSWVRNAERAGLAESLFKPKDKP